MEVEVEPTLVALGVLTKVFGFGAAVLKAKETWVWSTEMVDPLVDLLTKGLALGDSLLEPASVPRVRLVAQHTLIVSRAFATAYAEHWAGDARMAPDLTKRSWRRSDRTRDLQQRLALAIGRIAEPTTGRTRSDELHGLQAMIEDPVTSPAYAALWWAFTAPSLEEESMAPPLVLTDVGAKPEFERAFRMAYAEGLSSSPEFARGVLELAKDRPRLLRQLVLHRMTTWGDHHVFGEGRTNVPAMPLEAIYVEPDGVEPHTHESAVKAIREPLRRFIKRLLVDHKVVVVCGDFGHGKSLTARMLGLEWARAHLNDAATPSPTVPYPVFVKCSQDFSRHAVTLDQVVRRALQRQGREFGCDLGVSDSALASPTAAETVYYLIDGLDEVVLGTRDVEEFFRELETQLGANHRAIVFSRRGVIPPRPKLPRVAFVDVAPFRAGRGGQVQDWLKRWNALSGRPAIDEDVLVARGLGEIAATPILLFMIAMTWDAGAEGVTNRAQLYEDFLLQVAMGKSRCDQDDQPLVAEASLLLLERVRKNGDVSSAPDPDQHRDRANAMLWMLSRIAWESCCRGEKGQRLTVHDVTTILREELDLRGDASTLDAVKVGLLLALQADQHGGDDQILFGHESFREFLVARYWAATLARIIAPSRSPRNLEGRLLGAPLLAEDDQSFSFLMELLNGADWTDRRKRVFEWAVAVVKEEEPRFLPNGRAWREDTAPHLRCAALGIASRLTGMEQVVLEDAKTLRSILAWFWLCQRPAFLTAPGLVSLGAQLQETHVERADLSGANLSGAVLLGARFAFVNLSRVTLTGANLMGADVFDADLSGADLSGAHFPLANLSRSNLSGANLTGADLVSANLRGASLRGADLSGADLSSTNLPGANVRGANLTGANLTAANLTGADLRSTNVRGANLSGANLRGANLTGADLRSTNLTGADLRSTNLSSADLSGTNLRGANLTGANVRGANLTGADLTGATLPDGVVVPGEPN